MSIDYARLRQEILEDPLQLGYAALLARKERGVSPAPDDAGIAALLNATTGAGVGSITRTKISQTVFLRLIAPATLGWAAKGEAFERRWDRMLGIVQAVETLDLAEPTTIGLIDAAVADEAMTADIRTAILAGTGSRAEVLFGAGTILSASDVGAARNSG
jgi:hypothetical protein